MFQRYTHYFPVFTDVRDQVLGDVVAFVGDLGSADVGGISLWEILNSISMMSVY